MKPFVKSILLAAKTVLIACAVAALTGCGDKSSQASGGSRNVPQLKVAKSACAALFIDMERAVPRALELASAAKGELNASQRLKLEKSTKEFFEEIEKFFGSSNNVKWVMCSYCTNKYGTIKMCFSSHVTDGKSAFERQIKSGKFKETGKKAGGEDVFKSRYLGYVARVGDIFVFSVEMEILEEQVRTWKGELEANAGFASLPDLGDAVIRFMVPEFGKSIKPLKLEREVRDSAKMCGMEDAPEFIGRCGRLVADFSAGSGNIHGRCTVSAGEDAGKVRAFLVKLSDALFTLYGRMLPMGLPGENGKEVSGFIDKVHGSVKIGCEGSAVSLGLSVNVRDLARMLRAAAQDRGNSN